MAVNGFLQESQTGVIGDVEVCGRRASAARARVAGEAGMGQAGWP